MADRLQLPLFRADTRILVQPLFVLLSLLLVTLQCHAQSPDASSAPKAAQAAADQRIADCIRTLPILVSEASPAQIQQACQDKYGLEGSYVSACLVQIRQIYTAEGKSFPTDEWSLRSQCSARERIDGVTRQPFDASKVEPLASAGNATLIWPSVEQRIPSAGKIFSFPGSRGSPVVAVADGQVIYSGATSKLGGESGEVRVAHSSNLQTWYVGRIKIFVSNGEKVSQGQKIAEMGEGDNVKFKLMFFVIRDEKMVDPLDLLAPR